MFLKKPEFLLIGPNSDCAKDASLPVAVEGILQAFRRA